MMAQDEVESVIRFWFHELAPRDWFRKDRVLDMTIAERFGDLLEAAGRGELWLWRSSARGRLAEVVVLDQFSRNIHRDTALAFARDPIALVLAQEAVSGGYDRELVPAWRAFFYLPFMHSESLAVHDSARDCFDQPGLEQTRHHEQRHRAVLERFGRYPHRNALLGRSSTPAERAFLAEPGARF